MSLPPALVDILPKPTLTDRAVGLGAVLLALGLVGFLASLFGERLSSSHVTMLFLIVVVWGAVTFGRLAGMMAAVAGSLASNFFFKPQMSFGFDTVRDAITLTVFLVVAFTISSLAAKVREERERQRSQAEELRRVSNELSILYQVGRTLAGVTRTEELTNLAATKIPGLLGRIEELADGESKDGPVTSKQLEVAVAEQIAQAAQRIRLTEEMAETRLSADGERLKRAMLESLSHDLRTPIGAIMGAASSLLSGEASFNETTRTEQLETILQAAQRLNRYVRNLLDNTLIESNALKPSCDWVDLADTISSALSACTKLLGNKPVDYRIEGPLPLLWLDADLIERVFVNLIENAVKFSHPEAAVEIRVAIRNNQVEATIFNPAIKMPDVASERLFDAHYRGSNADNRRGTGLGLSICRAFMRAHGGDIQASADEARHGLVFTLSFPIPSNSPTEEGLDD